MNKYKISSIISSQPINYSINKQLLESFHTVLDCINILFEISRARKSFQITENYFLNTIFEILEKGILDIDQESQIKLIEQLEELSEGIYDLFPISYDYSEENKLILLFGKVTSPENNNKKMYTGVLGEADYKINKHIDEFDFESMSVFRNLGLISKNSLFKKKKSKFECMNVNRFAGEFNKNTKPISVFYSGEQTEKISTLSNVVVFTNIYLIRFKLISSKLGYKYIKNFQCPCDEVLKKILVLWLRGHDLAHSFGEDNLEKNMKENKSEYYILHELKSDLISLLILNQIHNKFFDVSLNTIYAVFIAEMFRFMRRENPVKFPDSIAAFTLFNYLLDKNVLVYDEIEENFEIYFDMFGEFIEEYTKEIITIFGNGMLENALELLKFSTNNKIKDDINSIPFINDMQIPYFLDFDLEDS